jgi:hypothetical protein
MELSTHKSQFAAPVLSFKRCSTLCICIYLHTGAGTAYHNGSYKFSFSEDSNTPELFRSEPSRFQKQVNYETHFVSKFY